MPVISRFLGIIIMMYYHDHQPPHFHIKYNEFRASFSITEMRILDGKLPKRVHALVLEWAIEHHEELIEDWNRARNHEELKSIQPLE